MGGSLGGKQRYYYTGGSFLWSRGHALILILDTIIVVGSQAGCYEWCSVPECIVKKRGASTCRPCQGAGKPTGRPRRSHRLRAMRTMRAVVLTLRSKSSFTLDHGACYVRTVLVHSSTGTIYGFRRKRW